MYVPKQFKHNVTNVKNTELINISFTIYMIILLL